MHDYEKSNRDPEPTGQMSDDTRLLSDSRHDPDGSDFGAPQGTPVNGGHGDRHVRAPHRRTSVNAAPGAVVQCIRCHLRLRWTKRVSGRARCPHCGARLIVRRTGRSTWRVVPENQDSLAGMICDWLG